MNNNIDKEAETIIFNTPENINGYAALLHNQWRSSRKQEAGLASDGLPKREERLKPVNLDDPDGPTIDIANTPFEDLSPDWQKENLAAAKKAMDDVQALAQHAGVVDLEESSAGTHVDWKKRSPWAEGEQAGPYSDLSFGEKEKDRGVISGALEYLQSQGYDIRAVNKGWQYEERLHYEAEGVRKRIAALSDSAVSAERDALNKDLKQAEGKISQWEFAGVLDRPDEDRYGGAVETGTEGAKRERRKSLPGGEDRYGYLDGESREDRDKRMGKAA